jgi:hypothetical protein
MLALRSGEGPAFQIAFPGPIGRVLRSKAVSLRRVLDAILCLSDFHSGSYDGADVFAGKTGDRRGSAPPKSLPGTRQGGGQVAVAHELEKRLGAAAGRGTRIHRSPQGQSHDTESQLELIGQRNIHHVAST